ncbi:copper resistance protein CopC [Actinoplanes sp. M2I2]|uniref:copper resistance protein CopC n=1 Tax=Actinoplanes sp. M2I2 TaxID=1734444 RepID=UPI0035B45475
MVRGATATVTQPIVNGTYLLAYCVVSQDGHTVQGSYTFTVANPALPAAGAALRRHRLRRPEVQPPRAESRPAFSSDRPRSPTGSCSRAGGAASAASGPRFRQHQRSARRRVLDDAGPDPEDPLDQIGVDHLAGRALGDHGTRPHRDDLVGVAAGHVEIVQDRDHGAPRGVEVA